MKTKKLCLLAILILLCLLLFACNTVEERIFIDRSNGWQASLIYSYRYSLDAYRADSFPDTNNYWQMSVMPKTDDIYFGQVELSEVTDRATEALQLHYGNQFINAGTGIYRDIQLGYKVLSTNDDSAWIFFGGETAVIISKANGLVMGCIDTRIEPVFDFYLYNWKKVDAGVFCERKYDLAQCTREELLSINNNTQGYSSSEKQYYDMTDMSGPLTAEDAYLLAIETGLDGKLGPAEMEKTYGDYIVYYCEKSDAYAIVTGNFIEMIARDNGELLFLSSAIRTRRAEDLSVIYDA